MAYKKGFCSGGGAILSYENVYRNVEVSSGRRGEVYFGEGGRRVVCFDCGRDLRVTTAGLDGSGSVPRHKKPVVVDVDCASCGSECAPSEVNEHGICETCVNKGFALSALNPTP